MALLIQEGGANRSKNNITVKVNQYEFSLKSLRFSIKQTVSSNTTIRQLARTLSKEILKIALAEKMRGPLVNELQKIDPNKKIEVSICVAKQRIYKEPKPKFNRISCE